MILDKTIKELERAFDFINERIFESELDKPIFTIQTSGKGGAWGWCTIDPIWESQNGDLKYEINMVPEYFDKGEEDICHILLHEMCHLYNTIRGIKDCSGKKHNKKYKETAEKFGLYCDKNDSVGWGVTRPKSSTIAIFNELNFDKSVLEWKRIKAVAPEKEKVTKYKYTCENCAYTFTIKYELDAKCKDCGSQYVVVTKEPKED